ncbi:hypothetical protein O7623_03245 [Solwaraspora sp. WMMD791]|uniref:hypothetical protein n=1 Tax=Solwaraspora sp. WMMD791 TaxID=3016086 RepID=UPI00249B6134|nr:hypothetical protein [Solwaraspora sp. WMMD791]WFE28243.1 hypothetical protein O7623_03245 [Solwaraspora sp. WMMD791]
MTGNRLSLLALYPYARPDLFPRFDEEARSGSVPGWADPVVHLRAPRSSFS